MDNSVETTFDVKRGWAAPDLQKIDLEKITASSDTGTNEDDFGETS